MYFVAFSVRFEWVVLLAALSSCRSEWFCALCRWMEMKVMIKIPRDLQIKVQLNVGPTPTPKLGMRPRRPGVKCVRGQGGAAFGEVRGGVGN